ncbi:MAG: hypothetical protein KA479_09615 [Saprospiraceae bacterium]|nr:hypothetical protein [Saprospiraceae bacterium]
MEILNRNLRDNARWRIAGMACLVILVTMVIFGATSTAYDRVGTGSVDLRNKVLIDSILNMHSDINGLGVKRNALGEKKGQMDKEARAIKMEIKQLTKEIRRIEKEIESYLSR